MSPVPTYTMSEFDGATSTAPMDDVARTASNTGNHVVPALVVFHSPPPGKPA